MIFFFKKQETSKYRNDLIEFLKSRKFNFYGESRKLKIPYPILRKYL